MLNACYLGMTFLRLLRSTQIYLEAWLKTWALDRLRRHALCQCILLIGPNLTLATITSIKVTDKKTGVPFSFRNPTQKNRCLHRHMEEHNLQSRNSKYCFRLQDSVALQTCSAFSANYKLQPRKLHPNRCRGGDPTYKGSNNTSFSLERGFLQLSFLSPKKEGSFRRVIDLSFLNRFVENSHFQMENISCLKSVLQRGDYMTTLYLKDAYLSVPIHRDSQKFLQFLWRNKCYAFQGLCFGLNTAPRVFTKLLKPIAAYLCKRDVRMILYLDDFLILGSSYQEVQRNTIMAVTLLDNLGFTVNREKSHLILTQVITFLGFVINFTLETLSLAEEKVLKVESMCKSAILNPTMPPRQLASLLGTLESCRLAIWQAPLHFCYLQSYLQNFDVTVLLDYNSLRELKWWVSNIDSINSSPITPPLATLCRVRNCDQLVANASEK